MSKDCNQIISELKTIREDTQQKFGELSFEQLNWRTSDESWSIAQCFEHLVITNEIYFENIQKVADGTHQNNFFSKIPFVTDITGAIMKKVLSPEWSKKMKTLKMFKPSYNDISENILEDFSKNQNRLISLMEATKDLDIRKIKVAEPIGAAVNLRLVDAFEVLVVHEKRHFNQAKRVAENEGFPK
ncbi:MAG: DinB family protein [Acidobacteriota bacterium]